MVRLSSSDPGERLTSIPGLGNLLGELGPIKVTYLILFFQSNLHVG